MRGSAAYRKGDWVYIGDAFERGSVKIEMPVQFNREGSYLFRMLDGERRFLPDRVLFRRDQLDAYHSDGNYPQWRSSLPVVAGEE